MQILPDDIEFLKEQVGSVVPAITECLANGMPEELAVNLAFGGGHGRMNIDEVYAMCCVAMVMLARERVDRG